MSDCAETSRAPDAHTLTASIAERRRSARTHGDAGFA